MANASSCLQDEWAIFNNIGGLSGVKNFTVAPSYDVHPTMLAFNRQAALVAVPTKFGVAGVGLYRFGDDLYNEQLISCGFSNRFGIASLGVKLNYIQYHAEGFGNKGVFSVSFGGIAQLTEHLCVGAHIVNINQPDISTSDVNEKLPTTLIIGIALKPSEKIILISELEKEIG